MGAEQGCLGFLGKRQSWPELTGGNGKGGKMTWRDIWGLCIGDLENEYSQ